VIASNKIKKYLLLLMLGFLSVIPASQLHAMVSSEIHPVRLTQKEKVLLESLACREKFDIAIDKIIASGDAQSNPKEVYAEVLCQPHANFKLNAIHHVVFCEKNGARWKCPRSELAIRMNDDGHALIYFEDDIAIETAYNIVIKLANSKYYQGEDVPKPNQSVCNIHQHFNDDHVPVPDVYVAHCELHEVFISTWCPQQECPRIIGSRIIVMNSGHHSYPARHAAL
jgi:hypothetical protein